MVSIWVGIYKGDANYMMNDFVDFACTGDAITVSEPTIVKQLKEVCQNYFACHNYPPL